MAARSSPARDLSSAGQPLPGLHAPASPPRLTDRQGQRATRGWRCTAPSFDPGRWLWEAVAIGPKLVGRHGTPPATVIGTGVDALAALVDLAERLERAS